MPPNLKMMSPISVMGDHNHDVLGAVKHPPPRTTLPLLPSSHHPQTASSSSEANGWCDLRQPTTPADGFYGDPILQLHDEGDEEHLQSPPRVRAGKIHQPPYEIDFVAY